MVKFSKLRSKIIGTEFESCRHRELYMLPVRREEKTGGTARVVNPSTIFRKQNLDAPTAVTGGGPVSR